MPNSEKKFNKLIQLNLLSNRRLRDVLQEASEKNILPEEILLKMGIPKHELLLCLGEYYSCPFLEFDEKITASYFIIRQLSDIHLKKFLWFPVKIENDRAQVISIKPGEPKIVAEIQRLLNVKKIDFWYAMPADLQKIIEHNFDVNANFPFSASRTQLAKTRTYLADRRSLLSVQRTGLAKGRTGLAFLRTGIAFITLALILFRILNNIPFVALEIFFLVAGIWMTLDGFKWYLPIRKIGKNLYKYITLDAQPGNSVLEVINPGDHLVFQRTDAITALDKFRSNWSNLSPLTRRRLLAIERTDLAEERTALASNRTQLALSRTALAFTRTGIAFSVLGVALLRQFPLGPWTILDIGLIITGGAMSSEGLYLYLLSYFSAKKEMQSVQKIKKSQTIWELFFPPSVSHFNFLEKKSPPVKASHSPGIWGTSGLALERTLLAERRNVMSRLRTVFARSRTGLAFIRTGVTISALGSGLVAYYGTGNIPWAIFDISLIFSGGLFISNGLYWHLPTEKIKKQYPYCFDDLEITLPEYNKPVKLWKKVIVDHANQ